MIANLATVKDYLPEQNTNKSLNSTHKTILILGGSTTDPLGVQFSGEKGTWPDQLGLQLSGKYSTPI